MSGELFDAAPYVVEPPDPDRYVTDGMGQDARRTARRRATGRRTTVVYATAVEPDGHEVVTVVGLVTRHEVSPRRYSWRTDDASHATRREAIAALVARFEADEEGS